MKGRCNKIKQLKHKIPCAQKMKENQKKKNILLNNIHAIKQKDNLAKIINILKPKKEKRRTKNLIYLLCSFHSEYQDCFHKN